MSLTMSDQARLDALQRCAEVYSELLTKERMQGYLRLLSDIPPDDLRAALDAHMRDPERGKFFPRPADIMAKLPRQQPKPMNADEAWAIAIVSFDEGASVVWNTVIEEARNAALPIWLEGDGIGARMAFKGAYDRLMSCGGQSRWKLSIGHDPARREEAVNSAIAAGLITAEQGRDLLPAPLAEPRAAAVAGLLAGKVVPFPLGAGENVKRLRDAIESATRAANQRAETRAAERQKAEEARRSELARQAEMLSKDQKL
jgi:hypothetical protein